MKQQTSYKTFFINYAIFLLIAVVVFSILIYIIKISQKSWDKNLKSTVEYTLEETEPDTWDIGQPVKINTPMTTSAVCFDARNKKSGENCKVVIIRLQTFYGPHSGIYIVENNDKVTFKGYTSLHGRCAAPLTISFTGRRVEYWNKRIAGMLK